MKIIKNYVKAILVLALMLGLLIPTNGDILADDSSKQLKVNNTTLTFSEIIYVDVTNGDDTNGDGSKDKPFQSIVKGFDYLNTNCRQGSAIVIKDGTYDIGGLFQGTSYNLSAKYNGMKISLLAETMGNVKFENFREMMVVENSSSNRIKVCVYGIILDNGLKGAHIGGDNWVNEYYNCVFTAGYGGYNKKVSSASVKVENSLFLGSVNAHYTSAPLGGTAVNCASTTQYMDPSNGTKTNALYNVTIDDAYNITSEGWENTGTGTNPDGSVANIGVYGGEFSWGSKVSEVSTSKLKVVLSVNEQLQLSVNNDLDVNEKMTWSSEDESVATVDENGSATGVSSGNTVITVTNQDGTYSETINLLVINDETDLQLAIDLKVGDTRRLTIDDLTDTVNATWASNSQDIATVSDTGKVTAVGVGTTFVTVTDDQGNEIGTICVRVRN